jgi:uncharacterized membrane protein
MNARIFANLYFISVPVFFAIDMIWLGLIADSFYQSKLGNFIGEINWIAAIIFYLLFLAGLTFFATYPAVKEKSLKKAALFGGLFGFFTYMTYDLTNLATLPGWPISIVIVDIVWGTLLGAIVTMSVYMLYTRIHK